MSSIYEKTIEQVRELRKRHEEVIVAYSGGKDSTVVLDLAVKNFKRVHACFWYFVPGLRCVEEALAAGLSRYPGVTLHQYPALWSISRAIKEGHYTSEWVGNEDVALSKIKMFDIYRVAMADLRCGLMLNGYKKSDSAKRRVFMISNEHEGIEYPLADWNKYHVLSYLKANGIPIPEAMGKGRSGDVTLATSNLLWLYDNYRDDFDKLCAYFPFAPAVVYRRTFYGITE